MFTTSQIESFLSLVSDTDMLIIVEGKKDKVALSKLGLKNIFDISGKTLEKCIDMVKPKPQESVVILTDFDDEGKKKSNQLSKGLSSYGIKVNHLLRKKFKSLFKLQKIEELNNFTKLMEDDYNGKTRAIYDKIFNRSRILGRRCGGKT